MVLAKVLKPESNHVVSENKFIVNTIYLVGIRSIENNTFLLLFVAHQDFDNSIIYFQTAVVTENEFEYEFFSKHELNLDNLNNSSNKKDTYQDLIQNIDMNNIFSCDMNMRETKDHPGYYYTRAVRTIDSTHCSIMNVYFTFHNFIRINVYLHRISNYHFSTEQLFVNKEINYVKLYNIEFIKLDASTFDDFDGEDDLIHMKKYTTHYTMNCGPKEFKVNYCFVTDLVDAKLKVALNKDIYAANYSQDHTIIDIFDYNDKIYILYSKPIEEYNIFDQKENKTITAEYSVLCIDYELAKQKTNLLDPMFIFIKEGE